MNFLNFFKHSEYNQGLKFIIKIQDKNVWQGFMQTHYTPIVINTTPCKILENVFIHGFLGFCKYVKLQKINSYRIDCSIPNCYVCNLH